MPLGVDFGTALQALKDGYRAARRGWNGAFQFVYYVPGGDYTVQTEVARQAFGETAHYRPYLALRTAQGDVATWVPSISDCLAEDWIVLED